MFRMSKSDDKDSEDEGRRLTGNFIPNGDHTDFDDDFDDQKHVRRRKLGTLAKLCLILFSYGTAFLTMINLGYWLADINDTASFDFQEEYSKTPFLGLGQFTSTTFKTKCSESEHGWILEIVETGDWFNTNIQKTIIDIGLLLLFVLQHTLLSSRVLKNTRFWYALRHQYKIDKPLYMVTTAFILSILIKFWERIPVKVWDMEIKNPALQWIHIIAWASMYGTCLMLDLPEMIGLNQVVIESPTMTVKSPEFQMMLQQQRHMGLVPFVVIFVTYPYMSLDRLILSLFLTSYLCRQWASDFAYEYTRDMKHVKKLKLSL